MSKTQSNQTPTNDKPLAERSSEESKPTPDDINSLVRYRDNLKLIPETMEYDDNGRELRRELMRIDDYLWRYNNGHFG